jgi:hypothetical protein
VLLNNSGHLRTLAFLYGSKGMDSKSLAIWRHLARNYAASLWRETADTLGRGTSSERKAAEEASKILQFSSDQELVLGHHSWVRFLALFLWFSLKLTMFKLGLRLTSRTLNSLYLHPGLILVDLPELERQFTFEQ